MHHHNAEIEALAERILGHAKRRVALDDIPLGAPRTADELAEACGPTITPGGIGGEAALALFADVLEPASLSVDYPRYLSFVPAAPTEAAVLFDLVVGASSIYGGSWIEGAGAVHAENEALRWLADLAGMPDSTGGVFVPGGTMGNLSAMVAARDDAAAKVGDARPARWKFVASRTSHSSVKSAAQVMDAEVVLADVDDSFRMTGAAVREGQQTWASSMTSGASPTHALSTTCGCTSTGRTGAPRSSRSEPAHSSTVLHRRTASSSTRTSGSSPRLIAARCCTATRPPHKSPMPNMPATCRGSTPGATGTQATSRSI